MAEAVQSTGVFSPAADLDAAYRKYMTQLVHLNGPSPRTRASGIGNECERAIFYDRTVPAEQRVRHTPELQAIFELGKDFEKIAIRRLEDMGAEIVSRGRDYADVRYDLSGHTDAKIRMPWWPRSLTSEIKGLNPYSAESIESLHDIRESRQSWIRKYFDQLQTYLLLAGEELGVFILFNKSTGWPTFIDCPLDYEYAEGLLKKAERLKLHVVENRVPDRHLSKECRRCAFVDVCGPDLDYGAGIVLLSDPELEVLIQRRQLLEEAAHEFKAIDKVLKDALPKREGDVLLGDFVISSKEIVKRDEKTPRKGYTYYRRDIRRLGEK